MHKRSQHFIQEHVIIKYPSVRETVREYHRYSKLHCISQSALHLYSLIQYPVNYQPLINEFLQLIVLLEGIMINLCTTVKSADSPLIVFACSDLVREELDLFCLDSDFFQT